MRQRGPLLNVRRGASTRRSEFPPNNASTLASPPSQNEKMLGKQGTRYSTP